MIALIRCDDRLIHGQCMTVIVKEYDIKTILVVDDMTASNPILKSVFAAAVPSNMKARALTVDEAVPKITAAMGNEERTLVLMKSPEVYCKLLERIPDLPKDLNVGPMSNRKGSTEVNPSIHLMPNESAACAEAADQGVHVWFRQVPGQPIIEWDSVKDRF
ncbi:PTS mannose/fructose/sorbose transporter subunit IIB [[Collinsella] massiliensis]|uniref:PTS mannose/fructose/sorbose transporter subunit IIB n=2 Tax=[Collinsella] massiliensis TaxID=1232426 RepID=A0A1Y3XVB6_9ACTN|nr:PTS sugar transporter subunit IIB [[Collinsella] massiliensis]OUN89526.1 PTS mannose/fructose/sorbose transporter subunit IIB [[Collinsella] massiliensis]